MDWVQWLLSFIGVLGLILLLFYALKKLNKGISVKSGNRLRVLDRISLGRDGMLLVISVCGKLMLIGATSNRVEKLCDLDIGEDEYTSERQNVDFKTVFSTVMGKNRQEEKPLETSNGGKSEEAPDDQGKQAEKAFDGQGNEAEKTFDNQGNEAEETSDDQGNEANQGDVN